MELGLRAVAGLRSFSVSAFLTPRQFLHGLLLLSVLFLISGTTGDPDLWGHVRFGQDMLNHWSIRLPDTYSFTSDQTWINHEWLAELLMAAAFDQLGPVGLNLLRIAVIAGVLALVWLAARDIGDRRRVMLVAMCALGIYLRVHPIRPQMFSLLMFAWMLTLLKRADDRHSLSPLMWIPVVMIAWVNLHGGWVVGLGVFMCWSGMRAIADSRHRVGLACAAAAALGSTLLNPYGSTMWRFLAETVRLERPMIGDWQPLYALPPLLWMSWVTGAAIFALAARSSSRSDWPRLAIVTALGIAAIRVSRLDAFFALAAVFATATTLPKLSPAPAPSHLTSESRVFAGLFAVCAVLLGFIVVPRISTIPVPANMMPDASVAAYVRDEKLTGNVLTWFNWGEYSIWHFGPDLKVSMDGRRETVYSPRVVNAHFQFYFGTADEWRYTDVIKPDYVWVPKQLRVVPELQRRGWHRLCEGKVSVLLARQSRTRVCPGNSSEATRLFPQL